MQSINEREHKRKQSAYFDKRTGGFYVMQGGHNFKDSEIGAAKILAKNGYEVILQPEGDGSGGASFRLTKKGGNSYPEGKIGKVWYEQSSVEKTIKDAATTIKKGLIHAHDKGVELAVIYDPKGQLRGNSIEQGIRKYNGQILNQQRTVRTVMIITKHPTRNRWDILERQVQ